MLRSASSPISSFLVPKNIRVERAIQLFENGKLRRAERQFLQVLETNPDDIDAHFHLCRIYRRLEDLELAVYHGRRVLRLNPAERNACLNLGLAYETMGNLKLAVRYYLKELKFNSFSGETLFNIGHLYFEKRRWLQASRYLSKCFQIGYSYRPEDVVSNLGVCYYKLRDSKSYIELYRLYLERVPNAGWAVANLGAALLRSKDYRGAILKFVRAKQLGTKRSVDDKLTLARKLYRDSKGRPKGSNL
jgi:Tfp pilus assembly protein PilF